MKKTVDSAGLLPLKILQIGHGSFGAHLAKHTQKRVQQFIVTSQRILTDLNLKSFDYIFLATNDSSLQKLVEDIGSKSIGPKLIHFSGFHHFANALGLHPVASFNKESVYDLDQITFVADGALDKNLQLLFKNTQVISAEKKNSYHNFLSISANAMQLMVHNLGKDFSLLLDLDPNLLKDIVIQSLQVERDKGAEAFSGPWVRNEKEQQDETVKLMSSVSLKNLNEHFKKEIELYRKKESIHEHS